MRKARPVRKGLRLNALGVEFDGMPLPDELYKALLDESRAHREKLSTYWLQKFSILGAIIAFAATRSEVPHVNPELVTAAILALPVIAMLLDFKVGEAGIHAKIIDNFIIANYPADDARTQWEQTKWGVAKGPEVKNWLAVLRSWMTTGVTIIPTCMIAGLAALATKHLGLEPGWQPAIDWTVICFCAGYLLLGIWSMFAVVFESQKAAKKAEN